MQLIEDIKNKIGSFSLARQTSHKKKRKRLTYGEVEHIGIVYDAALLDKESLIHQYANTLRKEGKKVFLLGYVNAKQLPGNKKFSIQSEYFWQEKLNAINIPVKSKIGRFLEIEFDWLLNLYTEPVLPLLAIAAFSTAKYRVGPNLKEGFRYFDAMIDTGTDNNLSLLIEQMDFYLKVIK